MFWWWCGLAGAGIFWELRCKFNAAKWDCRIFEFVHGCACLQHHSAGPLEFETLRAVLTEFLDACDLLCDIWLQNEPLVIYWLLLVIMQLLISFTLVSNLYQMIFGAFCFS
ncbi:hypothetical protein CMV_021202 [Castanea mollissima]|uniref:Uncharacterized protein n=1 Tax=Castanea mollissima TaxID=60419 RepID=A0A8J4QUW6_9ROSI|nr:hypothetical protein CMV_021202 [Castanea mollissima]